MLWEYQKHKFYHVFSCASVNFIRDLAVGNIAVAYYHHCTGGAKGILGQNSFSDDLNLWPEDPFRSFWAETPLPCKPQEEVDQPVGKRPLPSSQMPKDQNARTANIKPTSVQQNMTPHLSGRLNDCCERNTARNASQLCLRANCSRPPDAKPQIS